MASFASCSFYESPSDGTGYPSWNKAMILAVKPRPNDDPVIQEIGEDVQRAAIAITCTAAQLSALQDKVLESGSLVMNWETVNAFLDSISPPQMVGIGNDLFFATLNFIRL
jgi:hypothetical protein